MKCIVCGNEGTRPRSKFCCTKCEQKYYYETHKEERQLYKKKYYESNKEEYKKRKRKWIAENRDRWNEYQKKYKRERSEDMKIINFKNVETGKVISEDELTEKQIEEYSKDKKWEKEWEDVD